MQRRPSHGGTQPSQVLVRPSDQDGEERFLGSAVGGEGKAARVDEGVLRIDVPKLTEDCGVATEEVETLSGCQRVAVRRVVQTHQRAVDCPGEKVFLVGVVDVQPFMARLQRSKNLEGEVMIRDLNDSIGADDCSREFTCRTNLVLVPYVDERGYHCAPFALLEWKKKNDRTIAHS